MRVSVQASALLLGGYPSALDGLGDLALRRLELDVSPLGETLRVDAEGWTPVSIADENGARAYRQALFDHAVGLSGLRLMRSPEEDGTEAAVGGVLLALQAAEVLGAPVVRLDAWDDRRALLGRLAHVAPHTSGLRVTLALAFPDPLAEPGPPECALEEGDREAGGLSLDVAALFVRPREPEGGWKALSAIAPHVRCAVCGAPAEPDGDPDARVPLAESGIDYARIAAILGCVGYRGALTISAAGREASAREVLRADAAYLKDILGEY